MLKILQDLLCKNCESLYSLKIEKEFLLNKVNTIEELGLSNYINNNIESCCKGEVKIKSPQLVKILAQSFYDAVKDTENCVVMNFKNNVGEGVDVIVVKEGKMAPLEKLKMLEKENKELKNKVGLK